MSNSLLIHDVLVDSSHIVSGNLNLSHSMMGETLAADDQTITIDAGMGAAGGFYEGYIPFGDTEPYETADDGIYFLQCVPWEAYLTAEHEEYLTADEEEYLCAILPLDVSSFVPGDEMLYYWKNKLVGKYYLQKMTRQGRARYKMEATSAVGLLIQSTHYGGVYSDVKAGVIFADILGNIPYSIDTALSNAVVYGYLPIASRRDNLQQLLFATGGALFTDNTGKLIISTMNSAIQGDFTAHRCYIGGSVEESDPVPAVDVTEHNYFAAAQQEPETLLEEGVDGTVTVQFNGPHYDLQCTGGTITESSANHAVIAAQAFVTLTGKPYQHITHIVRAGDSTAKENVKTVTNATLANPQIAQALAKRLYALLQCNTRIRQDVLFGDERAGQLVTVCNPYTLETETAAVTEFDVTMSGVNKASGNFLVGFEPQGVLSGYQHYFVLTGSGEWTVPEEATNGTIRVILIGAGSGGNGGQAGENGQAFNDGSEDYRSVATAKSDSRYGGDGGDGGKAGSGGAPGKIFEFTLTVSPGEVFSYSCGIGGSGGTGGLAEIKEERTRWEDNQEISYEEIIQAATQPEDGAAGTATVFGGRSSDWGKEYPTGYYEPKTGLTIGAAGSDGYDGASGGGGGYYPLSDADVVNAGGSPGKGVGASKDAGYGGDGGAGARRESTYIPPDAVVWASGGGGGGGGSYIANGSNGSDGDDATGGEGGAGATGGTSANGATYGCGGNGGHGGGGGGGGGAAFYRDFAEYQKAVAHAGKAGTGGAGGLGGSGADGCIIIYY